MKKIKKILMGIILSLSLVTSISLSSAANVDAATVTIVTKTKSAIYGCKAHGNGCMNVRLSAKFISSKCQDVYWAGSNTHWPNAVTFGATKKYTSYARGTYTIYSSLITQWVSLSFDSETNTLYIYG